MRADSIILAAELADGIGGGSVPDATNLSMPTTDHSPATHPTEAAALMPEPGDATSLSNSASHSADGADDLIARLADQQIDGLLDDAAPDPEAADAMDAALQAASDHPSDSGHLVENATRVLQEELDQLSAPLAVDVPAVNPVAHATITPDVIAAVYDPAGVAAVDVAAESLPPAVEAPAEPDLAAPAAPSFNPPAHAEIDKSSSVAEAETTAVSAQPEEHSDAEAVARELAADVALLSTPLPAVVAHDAEVAASHVYSIWRRAMNAIVAVPMMILAAINFPVRPLSDRGREVIGAVGVVTLVNAAGLLIYLVAFAHRH